MGRALWYQDILDDNLRLRIENDSVKDENRRLRAENAMLRKQLGKDVRDAREAPFEENTPSSKQNFKKDSPAEMRARQGGAKPGHEGHGRKDVAEEDADERKVAEAPATCAQSKPFGRIRRTCIRPSRQEPKGA